MAKDHLRSSRHESFRECRVQTAPRSKRIVRVDDGTVGGLDESNDVAAHVSASKVAEVDSMILNANRLLDTRITSPTDAEIVRYISL